MIGRSFTGAEATAGMGGGKKVYRVLITGGRGQLGRELQRLLEQAGVEYEAAGLPELDVTDERAVREAVRRAVEQARDRGRSQGQGEGHGQGQGYGRGPARAVLVIHAAAYTAVDRAEDPAEREVAARVNVLGTRNVARACAAAGAPLVYVSTDFVFGGEKRVPYEVDDPPSPLNVYGATKLAGEQAVREICPQHYIVRTAWLFGVHGRNFPKAILEAARASVTGGESRGGNVKPLRVVNDQVGCPTYARDLAEAILLLAGVEVIDPQGVRVVTGATRGASDLAERVRATTTLPAPAPFGTYHITNGGSCSWYEFAREIVRLAGWPVEVEPITSAQLNRPARRPAYSVLSPARLRSVGLELRPWPEALRTFMAELRTHSPELFPEGG